jgi:hypothetical protein
MVHRADTLPEHIADETWDESDRTQPHIELLSTTLPVSARTAFDLFCAVERTPEWVSVIRSTQVLERTPGGLPQRAAFLAILEQATIGYTLRYEYDPDPGQLRLSWTNDPGGGVAVTGCAQFSPLSHRTSLMHYQLNLRLRSLPAWGDPFYDGHAASTVLGDFRDFVNRNLPV